MVVEMCCAVLVFFGRGKRMVNCVFVFGVVDV